MRFHLRCPEDYRVDRPELQTQQCEKTTGTNTPTNNPKTQKTNKQTQRRVHYTVTDTTQTPHNTHNPKNVSVVIASGTRPVPFRTRKLSPTALMVLQTGVCGRVRHRRPKTSQQKPTPTRVGFPHTHHKTPQAKAPRPSLQQQKLRRCR